MSISSTVFSHQNFSSLFLVWPVWAQFWQEVVHKRGLNSTFALKYTCTRDHPQALTQAQAHAQRQGHAHTYRKTQIHTHTHILQVVNKVCNHFWGSPETPPPSPVVIGPRWTFKSIKVNIKHFIRQMWLMLQKKYCCKFSYISDTKYLNLRQLWIRHVFLILHT